MYSFIWCTSRDVLGYLSSLIWFWLYYSFHVSGIWDTTPPDLMYANLTTDDVTYCVINTTICDGTLDNGTLCNVTSDSDLLCTSFSGICNITLVNDSLCLETQTYHPRLDEMWFTVSVHIADHVQNTQGSIIDVEVSVTGNTISPALGLATVQVQVTGTEYPNLIYDINAETFNYWTKLPGYDLLSF